MGNRTLRVNELLKREVSQFIHRELGSAVVGVTITDVAASSDYKSATVYFSMVGDATTTGAMESRLNDCAQEINQHLRHTITLRNIPRIRFKHDISMERGSRILQMLDEIDAEQKRRPQP
ncbi:MAG: 30S ribosome-binding factor RbfA [Opitutaceae bacterium]|nr:30S ribosome-binding factor RbfA [Opitutaceae bacterium]